MARVDPPRRPKHSVTPRPGFTLLELAAVVTLIGILALAGMARFGGATLKLVGAQSDARRIALDLHQARRAAISTGDNHYVSFNPGSGPVVDYTLYRRASGGDVVVEATREIALGVVVTPSAGNAEFVFDGTALASYSITIVGASKTWTVSVIAATGAIRVTKSP